MVADDGVRVLDGLGSAPGSRRSTARGDPRASIGITHASRRALVERVGGFWLRAMPMNSTDLPSGSKRRLDGRRRTSRRSCAAASTGSSVGDRRQRGRRRCGRPRQQRQDRHREQQQPGAAAAVRARGLLAARGSPARWSASPIASPLSLADASECTVAASPSRGSQPDSRQAGAHVGGDGRQHPVHEPPRVVGAERLGQLDRLGDDRARSGTSGRCTSSKTPMRSTARSMAGMRSSVQSLA